MFNRSKINELSDKINSILNDVDATQRVFSISKNEAEDEVISYSRIKDNAILGDKRSRDYIITKYTNAMLLLDIDKELDKYIDFIDIFANEVYVLFEVVLKIKSIDQIIDEMDVINEVDESMFKEYVTNNVSLITKHFVSLENKLNLLATLVYTQEYGQDCIDTIQYSNINEIGVLNKDYIYIIYKGNKVHLSFLSFPDTNIIMNIQKKTTQNAKDNYDKDNPSLITSKLNSSRVTVAGYDFTSSKDDLYYNERIFNIEKITLEEMRDKYKTINNDIYDFLSFNQQGRGSHIVTGADMGVGKSTFLLAMMEKIPKKWGIGILDTQNELQAIRKFPDKNIITLTENPKRTVKDSFEYMLKQSRDVLYVGEIASPDEMAELINAGLRLNAGVGATLHSITPFEVVPNGRNLLLRSGSHVDIESAEADISRAVDIIVHLKKLNNGRIIVESIVEVEHMEQNIEVPIIVEGSKEDKIDNLLNLLQQAIGKYLYNKNYRYNTLFKYNVNKDNWDIINLPSHNYFNKLSQHTGDAYAETIKSKLMSKISLLGG